MRVFDTDTSADTYSDSGLLALWALTHFLEMGSAFRPSGLWVTLSVSTLLLILFERSYTVSAVV